MADKTYNGWTNYETWAAKLWIDNEQSTYYDVTGHATEVYTEAIDAEGTPDKYEFADWLKEYVEENMLPDPDEIRGLASDLLNAAMSEVNWSEMAEAYLGDAKENADRD